MDWLACSACTFTVNVGVCNHVILPARKLQLRHRKLKLKWPQVLLANEFESQDSCREARRKLNQSDQKDSLRQAPVLRVCLKEKLHIFLFLRKCLPIW